MTRNRASSGSRETAIPLCSECWLDMCEINRIKREVPPRYARPNTTIIFETWGGGY